MGTGLGRLTVTAPRNTPQRAPVSALYAFAVPVVVGGQFRFLAGCAGLVGARLVHRGLTPVAPTALGEWLVGDGETIAFVSGLQMSGPPYEVELQVYNLDDTWPHTVECRVEVSSR